MFIDEEDLPCESVFVAPAEGDPSWSPEKFVYSQHSRPFSTEHAAQSWLPPANHFQFQRTDRFNQPPQSLTIPDYEHRTIHRMDSGSSKGRSLRSLLEQHSTEVFLDQQKPVLSSLEQHTDTRSVGYQYTAPTHDTEITEDFMTKFSALGFLPTMPGNLDKEHEIRTVDTLPAMAMNTAITNINPPTVQRARASGGLTIEELMGHNDSTYNQPPKAHNPRPIIQSPEHEERPIAASKKLSGMTLEELIAMGEQQLGINSGQPVPRAHQTTLSAPVSNEKTNLNEDANFWHKPKAQPIELDAHPTSTDPELETHPSLPQKKTRSFLRKGSRKEPTALVAKLAGKPSNLLLKPHVERQEFSMTQASAAPERKAVFTSPTKTKKTQRRRPLEHSAEEKPANTGHGGISSDCNLSLGISQPDYRTHKTEELQSLEEFEALEKNISDLHTPWETSCTLDIINEESPNEETLGIKGGKDLSNSFESSINFDDEVAWGSLEGSLASAIPRPMQINEGQRHWQEEPEKECGPESPKRAPLRSQTTEQKAPSANGIFLNKQALPPKQNALKEGQSSGPPPQSELVKKMFTPQRLQNQGSTRTPARSQRGQRTPGRGYGRGQHHLMPQQQKELPALENTDTDALQKALEEKSVLLEEEIKRYQEETTALKRLRQAQETAFSEATRRKEEASAWAENLKRQTEEWCKAQRQQMQRERHKQLKTNETFQQKIAEGSSKRDKEEITALKATIEKMKIDQEMAGKKWRATERRLREKIKTQISQTTELQAQIEFLEKQRVDLWMKAKAKQDSKDTSAKVESSKADLPNRAKDALHFHGKSKADSPNQAQDSTASLYRQRKPDLDPETTLPEDEAEETRYKENEADDNFQDESNANGDSEDNMFDPWKDEIDDDFNEETKYTSEYLVEENSFQKNDQLLGYLQPPNILDVSDFSAGKGSYDPAKYQNDFSNLHNKTAVEHLNENYGRDRPNSQRSNTSSYLDKGVPGVSGDKTLFSLSQIHQAGKSELTQKSPTLSQPSVEEVRNKADTVLEQNSAAVKDKDELLLPDGRKVVNYKNGTQKEVLQDGSTIVRFINGDFKQTDSRSGTVKYFYAKANTTHITYADGLQVFRFPNEQVEKHYSDGKKEIAFPDGTIKIILPNGIQQSKFIDGVTVVEYPEGYSDITTLDGKTHREYLDGRIEHLA